MSATETVLPVAPFVAPRESLSAVALTPVKARKPATPMQLAIIALCTREQGATTEDLYTTTACKKGIPWRDLVANCAKRFDYVLSSTRDGAHRVHYFLTPVGAVADEEQQVSASTDCGAENGQPVGL